MSSLLGMVSHDEMHQPLTSGARSWDEVMVIVDLHMRAVAAAG